MHFFDRKYVCVEFVVSKIRFVPSVLFFPMCDGLVGAISIFFGCRDTKNNNDLFTLSLRVL